MAVDGEGVGGDSGVDCAVLVGLLKLAVARQRVRHTLGGGEVDDVAVGLEHVDLLDLSDGLDVHLLEGSLELLVVGARRPVDLLLHTSGGTLATASQALAPISLRNIHFRGPIQVSRLGHVQCLSFPARKPSRAPVCPNQLFQF